MHFCKLILSIVFNVFISSVTFSQKYFEGKTVTEISYSNTPENMRNTLNTTQSVWYYKKNKYKYETNSFIKQGGKSISFSSTMIFDFTKGDWLMIMDMPIYNTKTATLHNIAKVETQNDKFEKLEEYKTILGHNCQKIIITTVINNSETKLIGYADMNYKINASLDVNGSVINSPLFFESECTTQAMGTIITKIVSITEETIDDNFFNLNCPDGYKLTDIRKTFNNGLKEETFDTFSVEELETKLQAALKIEDFDTAAKLKEVIEKRGGQILKYRSKTISELESLLKEAVSKEDFETAEKIQKEIKNRPK